MKLSDRLRAISLAKYMVDQFQLDLSGLTVLTECASGAYALTPIMAALAGAEVWAFGRNSSYGSYQDCARDLLDLTKEMQLHGAIHCTDNLSAIYPGTIDLLTNSGALRPIREPALNTLKKTGVVSLMWETWEFREEELDLQLCVERDIPVIGTNEVGPVLDMSPYPGLLALKLLMSLQVEPIKSRVALIGGGLTGSLIAKFFQKMGQPFHWFADDSHGLDLPRLSYKELHKLPDLEYLDAVICAEHASNELLAGDETAPLSFDHLARRHPATRWGHLSGHISITALKQSGLFHFPSAIQPPRTQTYSTWELGIRPVLELNAAGLKVGELGCRARLSGLSSQEAIDVAVAAGIGQDWDAGIYPKGLTPTLGQKSHAGRPIVQRGR